MKSHSQGGVAGVTVSMVEQEWQELCVRLLGVTM